MSDNREFAPMHEFLTGFEKYNSEVPIYLESPFSDAALKALKDDIEKYVHSVEPFVDDLSTKEHPPMHAPRIMMPLSRLVCQFDVPKIVEEEMDAFIKPLYSEELRLAHHSYLDYSPKYSDYKIAPSLPPHIDAAETILTFNYMIDGNVDWPLYVDDKRYDLKTGDAVIFSSLNQPHFRPKRHWRKDDYIVIFSVNYSPVTDWRFTGLGDPIDIRFKKEERAAYQEKLQNHPKMIASWQLYNSLAESEGIPNDVHGIVEEI
jgi:hypothetical protein